MADPAGDHISRELKRKANGEERDPSLDSAGLRKGRELKRLSQKQLEERYKFLTECSNRGMCTADIITQYCEKFEVSRATAYKRHKKWYEQAAMDVDAATANGRVFVRIMGILEKDLQDAIQNNEFDKKMEIMRAMMTYCGHAPGGTRYARVRPKTGKAGKSVQTAQDLLKTLRHGKEQAMRELTAPLEDETPVTNGV